MEIPEDEESREKSLVETDDNNDAQVEEMDGTAAPNNNELFSNIVDEIIEQAKETFYEGIADRVLAESSLLSQKQFQICQN